MYRFDDRWVLNHPLTLVVFTSESLRVYDGICVDAVFYNDCLRELVVSNMTSYHDTDIDPVSDSFITQHGEPLPGIRYLGVAAVGGIVNRYFRIVNIHVTTMPDSKFAKATYVLAGILGEGNGVLDNLFEEDKNE